MLLVQLWLAFLLGALGPLAGSAGVRRVGGGWYAWSGVLLAAWVAGASGILVLRFPDWAVLYLFEAMGHSRWFIAFLGALLSLLAAWLGKQLVVPLLIQGRLRAAWLRTTLVAGAGAGLIALARERLMAIVTTFEFRQGMLRSAVEVTGFQGLLGLVLIGLAVPCLGVLLLLLVESARRGPKGASLD